MQNHVIDVENDQGNVINHIEPLSYRSSGSGRVKKAVFDTHQKCGLEFGKDLERVVTPTHVGVRTWVGGPIRRCCVTNQKVNHLMESAWKEDQWAVEGPSEWYLPLVEKWNQDVVPLWRNQQGHVIEWVVFYRGIRLWTRPMMVRGQTL